MNAAIAVAMQAGETCETKVRDLLALCESQTDPIMMAELLTHFVDRLNDQDRDRLISKILTTANGITRYPSEGVLLGLISRLSETLAYTITVGLFSMLRVGVRDPNSTNARTWHTCGAR